MCKFTGHMKNQFSFIISATVDRTLILNKFFPHISITFVHMLLQVSDRAAVYWWRQNWGFWQGEVIHTTIIKAIVHPETKIVSIYSPSCPFKPVWHPFFYWTKNKIFWRMLTFTVRTKTNTETSLKISACVLQKIVSHTGLEWHDGK